MADSNELIAKIERNQRNLLERIDELDRQVAEVLRQWANPAETELGRQLEKKNAPNNN